MAFQSNAQRTAPTEQNDSWKAQGFLNFYLPKADGSKGKLGAIGLKVSKPAEKKLIDFLNANGEEGVKALLSKMIVEYRSATPEDTGGFDLG